MLMMQNHANFDLDIKQNIFFEILDLTLRWN